MSTANPTDTSAQVSAPTTRAESSRFREKLILLFLGFALTTGCGGLIGGYLQYVSWKNQWKTARIEISIAESTRVFENISSLLDRRIYRMNQFLWSFDERHTADVREARRQEYRAILFDWNDNLNRNLASIEIQFGEEARRRFEHDVGGDFIEIGRQIEAIYYSISNTHQSRQIDTEDLEQELRRLSIEVYHYNLYLLEMIQSKIDELS